MKKRDPFYEHSKSSLFLYSIMLLLSIMILISAIVTDSSVLNLGLFLYLFCALALYLFFNAVYKIWFVLVKKENFRKQFWQNELEQSKQNIEHKRAALEKETTY